MTDVIYNYPKSSCACYECDKDKFVAPTGVPTNMSVRGCNFSPYYDCHNRRQFKLQQEPQNQQGLIVLNKGVVANDKFASGYRKIDSKNCPYTSCNGVTYLNSDPRLYNAAAADWIQLDSPPFGVTPKLNTLNKNKTLDCYGQNYSAYSEVNAGQVVYYITKDLADAFYEPVFSTKANVVGTVYKDPMGAMKPEYHRIPEETFNPIERDDCDANGDGCLSWINDSQYHRADLISKQMALRNQQRFAPRWTNIKS
jgi:hypothetical protein